MLQQGLERADPAQVVSEGRAYVTYHASMRCWQVLLDCHGIHSVARIGLHAERSGIDATILERFIVVELHFGLHAERSGIDATLRYVNALL